jgi:transposase
MNEGVYMTEREINRTEIFLKIKNKQLTQVSAAKELNLSIRHVQRLYRLFKRSGVKALASKKRSKSSNHQLKLSIKQEAIDLITCSLYVGFGPTFMCEVLKKRHRITISKETTRQLMIVYGVWKPRNKKSPVIHQQRERRARSGELTQIDSSPHKWFEERGEPCALIVFIDDATGQTYCKFVEVESTEAYMKTAWEYLDKYGKPLVFYSDKHNIFRVNIPNCNKKEQLTQFGRALKELDIGLICANSPQAKGRVERVNKTLQDRLVKELRMRNINTIEEANRFLKDCYLEEFNQQFNVMPLCNNDAHRKIKKGTDLSQIFCEKYERVVSKNLELQFNNTVYQIKLDKPFNALIGAKVTMLRKLDGTVLVKYKEKILPVVEYWKQPHNGDIVNSKEIDRFLRERKTVEISSYHPWMQKCRVYAQRRA